MGNYLVVAGDNLWNIATKDSIYGNPYQWPLIYKANSGQIRDADLIYAGQFFSIPKASMAEADAAIQHAKTRGAWTLGETEASDLDYLAQ
ncbi:MAG: LysM peptidoglycan-binding domain-containing protein [Proteobacteria bacterium]|nr:LysM peptidoglycan-binding domain-containing protein [Pseudomonadota bacterium]